MKLFRRISILTLVFALICAFSASAFAANSFTHAEEFMGGDHVVVVNAFIDQNSTYAHNEINWVVACESKTLSIDYEYSFTNYNNVPMMKSDEIESNDFSLFFEPSTIDYLEIKHFTRAVYEFETIFTAYGGQFSYRSGPVIITPQ